MINIEKSYFQHCHHCNASLLSSFFVPSSGNNYHYYTLIVCKNQELIKKIMSCSIPRVSQQWMQITIIASSTKKSAFQPLYS
jgi:hypothetical protein